MSADMKFLEISFVKLNIITSLQGQSYGQTLNIQI